MQDARIAAGLVAFALSCSCSNPAAPGAAASEPACVAGLSAACQPQYDPPTYATIFGSILRPTCASGTGTCHTSDAQARAATGGLVLEDVDQAYASLLGTGTEAGHARVIPGDPACSLIMKRLESTVPTYHMPPGPTSLSAGETCTIVKWISSGAAR